MEPLKNLFKKSFTKKNLIYYLFQSSNRFLVYSGPIYLTISVSLVGCEKISYLSMYGEYIHNNT